MIAVFVTLAWLLVVGLAVAVALAVITTTRRVLLGLLAFVIRLTEGGVSR